MTTPRLIHQFWTSTTNAGMPGDVVDTSTTWDTTHPDFKRIVWSLEELKPMLTNFYGLNVLECVEACRFGAMQSDIVRLALVYEFGGVWSDLKNRALEPFLGELVALGIPFFAEHPPSASRPDPTDYLCNALFGAPAKSPMIFDCLKEVCKNVNARALGSVFGVTGGAIVMKMVMRAANKGQPYSFKTLRYAETWGKHVKRTSASYNSGGHWSELQKTQGIYIDSPAV